MFKTIKLKIRRHFVKGMLEQLDNDILLFASLSDQYNKIADLTPATEENRESIEFHKKCAAEHYQNWKSLNDLKQELLAKNLI